MRIALIGAGGREHALGWALSRSPLCDEIISFPGNPGLAELGPTVPQADLTNPEDLLQQVQNHGVDFTVVGPEQPLVAGLVDYFQARGQRIFGPVQAAARLEGSKGWAKEFMKRHGIPTAAFARFSELEPALNYLRSRETPQVLKADGLAAGKGVLLPETISEAEEGLRELMTGSRYGEAGRQVVIEERLTGPEVSVFAVVKGENYLLLPTAMDYKRVGEGNTGPNTGGMGAIAPSPLVDGKLLERIRREIIAPTLRGLREEGIPYHGFLYFGLMLCADGPRVIEYNCRLGDPETQAVLPLLQEDLLSELVRGEEDLVTRTASFRGAAAVVVLASRGYPGSYSVGHEIRGLNLVRRARVFQAGTRRAAGGLFTAGGRVLAVSALGADLREAVESAYLEADRIDFANRYLRRDVGHDLL